MTTFPATYCPDCGTRLEERSIEGRDRTYCPDCERVVWHTPVPAASVAVVGSSGVLCSQRAIDPGFGDWAVPGGHMETGETPAETAVRELEEEVGLVTDTDALRIVGTHSPSLDDGKHMVVVDYAVQHSEVDGTPEAGREVDGIAWIHPDESGGRSFLPHHERIVRTAWERFGDE